MAKAWLVVYRDGGGAGPWVPGLSFHDDELDDAIMELEEYREEEHAVLLQLDLTRLMQQLAPQARKGRQFCPVCREDLPKAAFKNSGVAGVCRQCVLEST